MMAQMKKISDPAQYYSAQYNARASIPDHPQIFARWAADSAHFRRTTSAILDIPFGEAAEERLDLFPVHKRDAPLLVFIHGGWWRSLDKSDFSMVAQAYTKAGFNVALTNYTLAPAATIEQIVCQQLKALAWLYRHARAYDMDPDRIVIAGHSAGGHLAAMMMAALWPVYAADLPANLIKGGILLSGLYDLAPIQHAAFVNVDLQLTAPRAAALSPVLMQDAHVAPFITAVGALESAEFHRQSQSLAEVWQSSFRASVPLPKMNHLTICDAFADPTHDLFKASVSLIESVTF
jgi:arylformamidase